MYKETVMTLVCKIPLPLGNCLINNLSVLQSDTLQLSEVAVGGDEGRSCLCVQHWRNEFVLFQHPIVSR